MKFKTNIKCSGCVSNVTPHLNETVGEDNWAVNINDPQKILTIKTVTTELKVNQALQRAGYQAERIS